MVDNTKLSQADIVRQTLSKFSKDRIAPLFATRRLSVMSTYYLNHLMTSIGKDRANMES